MFVVWIFAFVAYLADAVSITPLRGSSRFYGKGISEVRPFHVSTRPNSPKCRKNIKMALERPIQSSTPNILIAGAPASGKGTQCEIIKEKFGVVHLSTGDILRAAVKEGTPLGIEAKQFMDAGKLVPDELIIGVVCDRLRQEDCQKQGWLLDGFPRTKAQADALSAAGMVPDCFILLDVPEDVLVTRVTGRRLDPETSKIYHTVFNPPENEEIAARLIQRSDDTAEKFVPRYKDFISNIDAIKSSYADRMVCVDGTMAASEVSESIVSILNSKRLEKSLSPSSDNDDDKPGKNLKPGGVRGGEIDNSGPLSTVSGVALLIVSNEFLRGVFATRGWTFPSSLAGMVGLFVSLCAVRKVSPSTAESIAHNLSPAVAAFKAWLPLLFVPPMVVLPNKLHLLDGIAPQFAALIATGAFLSILSSGLVADSLRVKSIENQNKVAMIKSSPVPALPSPNVPLIVAAVALSLSKLMPSSSDGHFLLQRIVGFSSTVGTFLASVKYLSPSVKKVVNPVLTCAAGTMLILTLYAAITQQPVATVLSAYFGTGAGSGDIISSLLGPAIISFGLQLYQYREMISMNMLRVALTTMFSAIFGLISSASLGKLLQITRPEAALAPLTRCITTPLALAAAAITGADPSLAAVCVVFTGILGASFGETLLNNIGVTEPVSVGLSVGASAHGIGTASVAYDPVKFAAAVISMTLTGFWTVALLAHGPTKKKIVGFAL